MEQNYLPEQNFFSFHTWAPLNSFRIFLPVNKQKCHVVIVFDRQEKMFISHYGILPEQLSFNQPIPYSFTRQKPKSSRINSHLITQPLEALLLCPDSNYPIKVSMTTFFAHEGP